MYADVLGNNDTAVILQILGLITLIVTFFTSRGAKKSAQTANERVEKMTKPNGNKPLTDGGSMTDALIRIEARQVTHARNTEQQFERMAQRFDGVDERINGVDSRLNGVDSRIQNIERRSIT